MARLTRPSSLLWGFFLALGGVALALRLRAPGHPALTWITTSLLALLALRVVALVRDWRRGRIPGTRILLPALLLVEGLGLVLTQASRPALQLRFLVPGPRTASPPPSRPSCRPGPRASWPWSW